MKRIFYMIIILITTIYMTTYHSYANGYLFISPQSLTLSETQKIGQLNLVNKSKVAKTYKIILKDYAMNPDGIITAKDFPYSARKILRFAPRRITLQPNESQFVNVSARFNSIKSDEEYHTHIEFSEIKTNQTEKSKEKKPKDKKLSFLVGATYTVSVPVFVSKGKPTSIVSLNDAQFEKYDNESGNLKLNLSRSGTKSGYIRALIEHISSSGQKTQLGVATKLKIYREVDTVTHEIAVTSPKNASLVSGKLLITLYDSHNEDNKNILVTKEIKL